jgi:fluoroquinolone resistance protein
MGYIQEKTFDRIDFTEDQPLTGEYEQCTFSNCDLSNADLTDIKFFDCEFLLCNLSLATLTRTTFNDVQFKDCKMLGLLFTNCNDFGFTISFENCILDHSSFYQKKMKKTSFVNSQLHEADFTGCDLTSSIFMGCDLLNAKFDHTILEKADLRASYNYSIDPETNRIKKAKFSLAAVGGLLDKYDIEIES